MQEPQDAARGLARQHGRSPRSLDRSATSNAHIGGQCRCAANNEVPADRHARRCARPRCASRRSRRRTTKCTPGRGHRTYKKLRCSSWWPNMQRDAADRVARCGQSTLSKASARVMDPGDFRTRPVSALFEMLSADVLELSIPSTRRPSSSDKAEGSAANANPFSILGDEEQPWRARQQVIEARAARKMAARSSKLARCRAAGDVRCQGATSTLPHADRNVLASGASCSQRGCLLGGCGRGRRSAANCLSQLGQLQHRRSSPLRSLEYTASTVRQHAPRQQTLNPSMYGRTCSWASSTRTSRLASPGHDCLSDHSP